MTAHDHLADQLIDLATLKLATREWAAARRAAVAEECPDRAAAVTRLANAEAALVEAVRLLRT